MSTLVRTYDDLYVECDMDYSKYVTNGMNYVPCIIKGGDLDEALPILKSYVANNKSLKEIRIKEVDNGIALEIPTTIMKTGKSMGETVDAIMHILLGIRHCLNTTR
jgi:hypothetical protein